MFDPDLDLLNDVIHARFAEDGFPEQAREALARGLTQVQTLYGVHAPRVSPSGSLLRQHCRILLADAQQFLVGDAPITPESLRQAAQDIFVVHGYCTPGLVTSRVTDMGPGKESYDKLIQKLVQGMHPLEQLAVLEGRNEESEGEPVPG